MMYEGLFKKLVGKIIKVWFSGDDYVSGKLVEADSEMIKLQVKEKEVVGFIYVELLQTITCVTTTEDIKLED